VTGGATVVMGRRTWDSLPERFRPLPGRRNVVLTRSPGWRAPGAETAPELARALAGPGDIWVIGGAQVYTQALPRADRLEVTELADAFDGDSLAPQLGAGWRLARGEPADGWLTSRTGHRYRFLSYAREPQNDAPI